MKIGIDRDMSMVVKIRIFIRAILFIGLMLAALFLSAGRWDYWHGWTYFLLSIYAYLFNWIIIPSELVQERFKPGAGTKKWDYVFQALFFPLIYCIPLIGALDGGRHHWTGDLPLWVNILAFAAVFLGYSLEVLSLWKNRFYSSTVRIQEERGHYVVDEGPYAFIRHPGYAGGIISYLGTPFLLNSLWALIPAGLLTAVVIFRTRMEDRTLRNELIGYADYAARVRYRLIPGIW